MGQEIERKFLVLEDRWSQVRQGVVGVRYCQGYIPTLNHQTVRLRIAGDQGYLTLKGPTVNLSRSEFEYPIPTADAAAMLEQFCQQPLIDKVRYKIPYQGLVWEVDEFAGDNHGLILAEVELEAVDQPVPLPDWVGQEVSGDRRYYNSYLVQHPFGRWP
jgi:adenylate cyclase